MAYSTSSIGAGELYPSDAVSTAASGALTGIASLIPGMREAEARNRSAYGASSAEFRGLADAFSSQYDPEVYMTRRRNLGRTAGEVALAQDTTAYQAGMAKNDVARMAQEYSQAMVEFGRGAAARNYRAQLSLEPLKELVQSGGSVAGTMLALEALRSRPEYADTSPAYKNDINKLREGILQAPGAVRPPAGGLMALDGSPATYQNLASRILSDQETPDGRASAVASLIMLSRATEGGVPDSELQRFVRPDVLSTAKSLVSFYDHFGVNASNMGYLSKQGQERLEGAVRNLEQSLATYGYALDADGALRNMSGEAVQRYKDDGEGAKDGGPRLAIPEEAEELVRGVLGARSQLAEMEKLSNAVKDGDYRAIKDALGTGALDYVRAVSAALAANAARGAPIFLEDEEGNPLGPDQIMAKVQVHHDALTTAADIPNNPELLASVTAAYLNPDVNLGEGQPFSVLLKDIGSDAADVVEIMNGRGYLGPAGLDIAKGLGRDEITVEDLKNPERANQLAGMLLADAVVDGVPDIKRALAGSSAQDNGDALAKNRRTLGITMGNRLNEVLRAEGGGVTPVLTVDGDKVVWKVLSGGEGAGSFGAVLQSVVADSVLETTGGVVVKELTELASLAQQVGIPIDGTECQAPVCMYARTRIDRRSSPEGSVVRAADRASTQAERGWWELQRKFDTGARKFAGFSTAVKEVAPHPVSEGEAERSKDSTDVAVFSLPNGPADKAYYTLPVGVEPVVTTVGGGTADNVLCMRFDGRSPSDKAHRILYLTPYNGLGSEAFNTCLGVDMASWLAASGHRNDIHFCMNGNTVDGLNPVKLFTKDQREQGVSFCRQMFGRDPSDPDGPAFKLMSACFPGVTEGRDPTYDGWGYTIGAFTGTEDIFADGSDTKEQCATLVDNVFDYVKGDPRKGLKPHELTPGQKAYLQQVVISTAMASMNLGEFETLPDDFVKGKLDALKNAYVGTGEDRSCANFMALIGFDSQWFDKPELRVGSFWKSRQTSLDLHKTGAETQRVGPELYVGLAREMGALSWLPENYGKIATPGNRSLELSRALSRQVPVTAAPQTVDAWRLTGGAPPSPPAAPESAPEVVDATRVTAGTASTNAPSAGTPK